MAQRECCKSCGRPWQLDSEWLEQHADFVHRLDKLIESIHARTGTRIERYRYNNLYVALVRRLPDYDEVDEQIWGFVAHTFHENTTMGMVKRGDVLRASTFTRPAKGARGNIYESNYGAMGVDGKYPASSVGPSYLK